MSLGQALLGFAGAVLVVVAFGLAAVVARRHWFPTAPQPLSVLIELVLALAGILAAGLVLGSIGWLRAMPIVLVSVVVAVVSATLLNSVPQLTEPDTGSGETEVATDHVSRRSLAVVAVAVAVVSVRWVSGVLQTIRQGFSQTDELHYHLTHAAEFAQSGRTWPVVFPSIGDGAAYHPAHSELLHAVGLVVLGSDFLSIFVNLVFLALALIAGWVIGGRVGNPVAGALVVAAVMSLWSMTGGAGTTLNDAMAIALLLAAVAFLVESAGRDGDHRYVVLAGIAAGLAAGTKLTVLVPVVVLTIVFLAWPARNRTRSAVTYVLAASVGGGYWYLRNLAATGNPVPALSVGPLPGPELEFQRSAEFPITDYLLDASIWQDYFLPGLSRNFGPLWPLIPLLAVIGGVAALTARSRSSNPIWALLSIAGFVSLAAYLVTPTSAGGWAGGPVLFVFNVRYAFPGLLLCAFAGLGHPALRRHPQRVVLLTGLVFLAANLRGIHIPRTAAASVAVSIAAATTWMVVRRPRTRPVVAVVGLGVGFLAGAVLQDVYLERRWTADGARWAAYSAVQDIHDTRIGITGYPQNYPFYGSDLSNEVVTLGDDSRGDELTPFERCEDFWEAVSEHDLDLVVVLSEDGFDETAWGRRVVATPTRWIHQAEVPTVLRTRDVEAVDVRNATPDCAR